MRGWLIGLFLLASGGWSAVVVKAQTAQQLYQSYLSTYRQQEAQYERERQLYLQGASGSSLASVLPHATQTFASRARAVIAYIDYLNQLVSTYVTDEATLATLTAALADHRQTIASLPTTFDNLTGWSQADNAFATAYAQLSETAYQCFAQIYWSELAAIIDRYAQLYEHHQARILAEAVSQLERERKARVLSEVAADLSDLQPRLASLGVTLPRVNSLATYQSFRRDLDQLTADTESSLRDFAALE